jgi:RNA recognition motif-containing protein
VDRSEFERARAMNLANRQVSLGYAFVTFSHADEAKKALLRMNNEIFIDKNLVNVRAKGHLDHSEFDQSYFLKKMKNEAQLVEQRAELREAKKRLRDFESNLENELPSLKRLKDFKSIAQELIENPKGKMRRHVSGRRTKRETEELYEKLKEFQKENPNIDVTSLFENDKLDFIRREQHKRSF